MDNGIIEIVNNGIIEIVNGSTQPGVLSVVAIFAAFAIIGTTVKVAKSAISKLRF